MKVDPLCLETMPDCRPLGSFARRQHRIRPSIIGDVTLATAETEGLSDGHPTKPQKGRLKMDADDLPRHKRETFLPKTKPFENMLQLPLFDRQPENSFSG